MSTALVAATLSGCALFDVARDCEGTDARVKELAAHDLLDSRPDGATVARGFEKADAYCWADSGDVVLYAGRTYAHPGTRAEVAAYYRKLLAREGWTRDPGAAPDGDQSFGKETLSVQLTFLTAEVLAEEGHGSRPDLTAGAGYSIGIERFG